MALCWSTEEFLEEDLQEPKANMLAMRAGRGEAHPVVDLHKAYVALSIVLITVRQR